MNPQVLVGVRRVAACLAVFGVLAGLSYIVNGAVLVLNFEVFRPMIELAYSEIFAIICAGVAAALLQARFWEWERLGGSRAGRLAAGYAVFGCALSAAVTAVDLTAPKGTPVAYAASNAAVMAAIVFILSPLIGPVVAGPIVLAVYFTHAVVNNMWADLAFLPITRYPDTQTHWGAVAALGVLVVVVHHRTRGATPWVRRVFSRDE